MEDFSSPGSSQPISQAERHEALRLVLASTPFRRSGRLRRLLAFVVERALEGEEGALSEQNIGVALFERRASYDTGSDNIVRVNATELRKRLEQFYADEGAATPVIIEVPRGSYRPLFRRRPASEITSAIVKPSPGELVPADSTPSVDTPRPFSRDADQTVPSEKQSRFQRAGLQLLQLQRPTVLALLLLSIVFGAVQTFRLETLKRQVAPWRTGRASTEFWQNFFAPGQRTTIVLADTSFAIAQDLANYQLTLDDYLRQGYQPPSGQTAGGTQDKKAEQTLVAIMTNRNSGSIADFVTARRILALDPVSPRLQVQFARDFSGEGLRQDSSILIGSTRSNPWVEPFQDKLFYRMQASTTAHTIEVRVIRPLPNEQSIYSTSAESHRTDGFCIIAFLPSLSGEGKTLIIAGTDSQATEAGGDFLVQEHTLELLQERLPGFSKRPFQVLLRTSRVIGSPLNTSIISMREGAA